MRRFLLCFVAAAFLALGASACSSTLNDAATIKYSLSGQDHEEHVTRADLVDEVRKIAADKPFATWLNQNGFTTNGDVTAGSNVSAVFDMRQSVVLVVDRVATRRLPSALAASDVYVSMPELTRWGMRLSTSMLCSHGPEPDESVAR